jgi:Protein of unknown function (DUF3455)
MNRVTVALTLGTAVAAFGVAACFAPTNDVKPVVQQEVPASAAVKVPDGNKLVASLAGKGVQTYTCASSAWTPLEPAATLSQGGNTVALHFKGPIWVSTVDGSEVDATAVPGAAVKHADAVPDLLLKASAHHGTGQFADITFVQRLATKGGLAPTGSCTDGNRVSVPYSATYTFWSAAK